MLPISSPGFGNCQEILTLAAGGRKWMRFSISVEASVICGSQLDEGSIGEQCLERFTGKAYSVIYVLLRSE